MMEMHLMLLFSTPFAKCLMAFPFFLENGFDDIQSTLTSKDFSVDETPDKLCGQLFWTDQMPNMDDTQLLSPTM